MMTLYIDCEFNSHGGDLISLALVPINDRLPSFYEVLDTSHLRIDQWVMENVMSKLGRPAISKEEFQQKLQAYLDTFEAVHVIADWPEDLAWLCRSLITGPGTRIRYPQGGFTLECRPVDASSKNPHNALADAEGLREHFAWEYITNPSGFDDWDEYLRHDGEWRPKAEMRMDAATPLQARRRPWMIKWK